MLFLTGSSRFRLVMMGAALSLSLFACKRSDSATAASTSEAAIPAPAPVAPAAQIPSLLTPEKQKALFDALDLSTPGMEKVKEAVGKGDFARAEHELAEYLRQRPFSPWTFDPHHVERGGKFNQKVADDAVNGRLQGGIVTVWHTFPNNDVDWLYNETLVTPGLPHNFEWQWQLCRMGFWNDLGSGYRSTGDERYAQAWVKQLRSYVAQCPVPEQAANNAPGSPWRTIEAGIRMAYNWPSAFFSFLLSPSVTDSDLVLYLSSSLDHAQYLRKFQTGGNWLTMEMNGLYSAGALFPEFKDAKEWRSYATERLHVAAKEQFLPDGAHYELSPGYHNVALDNVIGIPKLAKRVGRMDEIPPDYVATLEKAFDYNLYLMTPDRSLPRFNDSWPVNVAGILRHALDFFPDRQDYLWIATDGKEGKPPAETSHPFPWAGFYAMRSGWERDANCLVLRAGPIGAGHCHQEKLNLTYWAFGREILFDTGGGSYEQSKWRAYATDTFSCNTVLVDGKPQRRQTKDRLANVSKAPIDARWESTPDHDFVEGIYDEGYGDETSRPATHQRRVLFIKPDLAVVADTLTAKDGAEHSYQARWNLLTVKTEKNDQTLAVTTTDDDQPNFAVVPLDTKGLDVRVASAQTEPELLGWNVRKDLDPQNVPATTIVQTRQGGGVQSFLTLLVPIRKGAPNPVQAVAATGPGTARVTFADGRKLDIAVDLDPAKGIEATETLADGSAGRHVKAGGR